MPKSGRGGRRGGGAGIGAGGGSGTQQQNQQQNTGAGGGLNYNQPQKNVGGLQGVYAPGYDANGNPNVLKWQGQDDDKAARFLAKVHNDVILNQGQYQDNYGFYDGDFQKFSLAMGLNDKATVVSEAQFNQIVQQNNLQVLYRGEAGQSQVDRFLNSDLSHTGVGSYGDGFYFSESKSIADDYADLKGGSSGRVEKMALSPTARVITYSDLCKKMYGASARLKNGLDKAGHSATSARYHNDGEAQYALKLGYNVITMGRGYHYALTRDAFICVDHAAKPYDSNW